MLSNTCTLDGGGTSLSGRFMGCRTAADAVFDSRGVHRNVALVITQHPRP